MFASAIRSALLLATVGLSAGGCAAPQGDGEEDAVTVAVESGLKESRAGAPVTLLANLGSAQGATASASNGTAAVRWPATALKGTYGVASGQYCSTAAAPRGAVLRTTITISGSYASCN